MRKILFISVFWAFPAAADFAQDMEIMRLATDLGSLIASEEPCGLTYDQAAIAAYVAKTVPPEAASFPGTLQMMTMGAAVNLDQMTESAKTAHCTATAQTARLLGFISNP